MTGGRSDPAGEGRALVERLGGRWTAGGGMCRCPAHDDRCPSLSVRAGRSRLLLHCFAGCTAAEILRVLRESGMLDPARGCLPGRDLWRPSGARHGGAAVRLWGEARPIGGTPAARYLASRGIGGDPAELRYHHRTPHGPRPATRFRPAMIAAVRDATGLVAVHRTFLEPRRPLLAALPDPRCGLGRFGRGAVRLGGIARRLGLAEGIETALSASLLFGIPCWATLGTERFGLVELPGEVEELELFLDHDAGGRRAEALAARAFGSLAAVRPHYPPRQGDDWNDVLRASLALPVS